MTGRPHTDREYESELRALREQMLLMGATVETMLTGAVQAFHDRDSKQARTAAALDPQIDRLELEIDSACINILARRQPVASDLRFITTALKVVTDLERIGDLASNICERVIELGPGEPRPGAAEIETMADVARNMLRDSLDAFVQRNALKAKTIGPRDKRVDQLYADMFPLQLAHMAKEPADCDPATRVLSVAKYIERVADHSTNIAEMVIFMVPGEDVRHPGAK